MIVHIETSFEAAHHLPGYDGVCRRDHGHSYRVWVTIDGEIDKNTHMVVDFTKIKDIVRQFDHCNINDYLQYPTAEEMVKLFCEQLQSLGSFNTIEVELWETEGCSAKAKVLGRKGR